MAYNPYGGPPYGPPPSFAPFPGAGAGPPGMAPPPGLGPPPGMSSAPGMGPPPGIIQQQQNMATQANRPSGLPSFVQPPPNLPNINFNAPVIRLGASSLPNKPAGGALTGPSGGGPGGRNKGEPDTPTSAGPPDRPSGRGGGLGGHGHGHDRNLEQARANVRESMHSMFQPTPEDKLRTLFIHKIPEGVGGEAGIQKILNAVGKLRRWDSAKSQVSDHKGEMFGFAQFDDTDSLATAVELLKELEVPAKKQEPKEPKEPKSEEERKDDETKMDEGGGENQAEDAFEGIDRVVLPVTVDSGTTKYLEHIREGWGDEAKAEAEKRLATARTNLKQVIQDLFKPPRAKEATKDGDGDVNMPDAAAASGDIEVLNISLAQEDELAEIPAEMREVVAAEIAAFRERSNQRDQERLRKEEEWEEMERQRNGDSGRRMTSPGLSGANQKPTGPRGVPNAPSGPRGHHQQQKPNGTAAATATAAGFVNGGAINGDGQYWRDDDDDDTDASDDELHQRDQAKHKADEDKLYLEAERKWTNRERARQGALDRETERDRAEVDNLQRRKAEQLDRDKSWDDEREASRKSHLYYRDRGAWARKRAQELGDERARDDADRRAETGERRKEEAQMAQARGMADSFLEQLQERELEIDEQKAKEEEEERRLREEKEKASAAAPQQQQQQRLAISFGAAAQKVQTQRAAAAAPRRTFAEVEGLLDDEEHDQTTRRQLVPITFEPLGSNGDGDGGVNEDGVPTGSGVGGALTDEEVQKAVRALAAEIPTDKSGLWGWEVKWDYMEESIIRDKLRPFVEKKVVEYLGVQEDFVVDVVVDHLRSQGKPAALVEELEGALDEDAEDLVKKLWRMVIFFTESEKRGLPA